MQSQNMICIHLHRKTCKLSCYIDRQSRSLIFKGRSYQNAKVHQFIALRVSAHCQQPHLRTWRTRLHCIEGHLSVAGGRKKQQVSSQHWLNCPTIKTGNCFVNGIGFTMKGITFFSSCECRRRRDQDSETDCLSPAAFYELQFDADAGRTAILTLGVEELFRKDKRTLWRQRTPCPRHLSPCPRCPPARWPWNT